jgi:membrane protein DedA with SNARE-associated domain
MSPAKFFGLNFLGALVWAITFGVVGYQFGAAAESMLGEIQQYEMHVLLVLVVIAGLLFWRSTHKAKQARIKEEASEQDSQNP